MKKQRNAREEIHRIFHQTTQPIDESKTEAKYIDIVPQVFPLLINILLSTFIITKGPVNLLLAFFCWLQLAFLFTSLVINWHITASRQRNE